MADLVICDDEERIIDILSKFFAKKGHSVFATTEGARVLERLHTHSIDVIITDVTMHPVGGLDILRTVQALKKNIPVIVTTGNPSHDSAITALKEGAFDHLIKPFHLEEISERCEKAILSRQMKEENLLNSKLVSLHSVSRILAGSDSSQELYERIGKLGRRLLEGADLWYFAVDKASSTGLQCKAEESDTKIKPLVSELSHKALEHGDLLVSPIGNLLSGLSATDNGWAIAVPVEVKGFIHGVLCLYRGGGRRFENADVEVITQFALILAINIRAMEVLEEPLAATIPRSKSFEPVVQLLASLVDDHCRSNNESSLVVKYTIVYQLGLELMRSLSWPQNEADDWLILCHIYDVGKLRLPKKLLEKHLPLSKGEKLLLSQIGEWSAEKVHSIAALERFAPLLENYQRAWAPEKNGSTVKVEAGHGTATATMASTIPPPLSRLLSVCDAYASMLSPRPYREALTEVQAMEEIRKNAGKKFDPEIVLALSRLKKF